MAKPVGYVFWRADLPSGFFIQIGPTELVLSAVQNEATRKLLHLDGISVHTLVQMFADKGVTPLAEAADWEQRYGEWLATQQDEPAPETAQPPDEQDVDEEELAEYGQEGIIVDGGFGHIIKDLRVPMIKRPGSQPVPSSVPNIRMGDAQ